MRFSRARGGFCAESVAKNAEKAVPLPHRVRVEQFSFERGAELHDFYAGAVAELFGGELDEPSEH